MRRPVDGTIVSIFGMPGSGKTTFGARVLIREVVEHKRFAVVFDPQGDVMARAKGNSAHGERLPPGLDCVVRNGAEVEKLSRPTFWKKEPPFRVFVFNTQNFEFAAESIHWLAKQPWTRDWVFFIDEVEEVWGRKPPQGVARQTLKLARNRGQVLILTGQVPQETSTLVRRNTQHACVFKSDSLDFVNPGCQGFGEPKLFDVCHSLKRHQYVYKAPWRDDPLGRLPVYSAIDDPIPWA